MIWLTWRQHRAETLTLAITVAALAIGLVLIGLPMHEVYDDEIAPCLAPGAAQTCGDARTMFLNRYSWTSGSLVLLTAVPFVVGGFLGAPLVARELEANTLHLAWTQAVPRRRWLAIKLTALAGATVVLSGAFAAVATWFRSPLDSFFGPFTPAGLDIEGLTPVAYSLFAFTLATAAGVLLHRSLPALAAALVVFVLVRAAVASVPRPRFLAPQILIDPIPENPWGIQIGGTSRTDWSSSRALPTPPVDV